MAMTLISYWARYYHGRQDSRILLPYRFSVSSYVVRNNPRPAQLAVSFWRIRTGFSVTFLQAWADGGSQYPRCISSNKGLRREYLTQHSRTVLSSNSSSFWGSRRHFEDAVLEHITQPSRCQWIQLGFKAILEGMAVDCSTISTHCTLIHLLHLAELKFSDRVDIIAEKCAAALTQVRPLVFYLILSHHFMGVDIHFLYLSVNQLASPLVAKYLN